MLRNLSLLQPIDSDNFCIHTCISRSLQHDVVTVKYIQRSLHLLLEGCCSTCWTGIGTSQGPLVYTLLMEAVTAAEDADIFVRLVILQTNCEHVNKDLISSDFLDLLRHLSDVIGRVRPSLS